MFTYLGEFDERDELNCTNPAIEEFPPDGFTRAQRAQGYIAIHFFISLYIFIAIATVCDEYFVPSVERLCHALDISTDVAGATFMAAATSAPEMFVNIIGTFITEGDLGVGTIVGSAVFNSLGVAAVCGMFSGMTVKLNWWPLSRDVCMYSITVGWLIFTLWDGHVQYYEAATMVSFYFVYLIIMYNDKKLQKKAKRMALCKIFPCFEIRDDIPDEDQDSPKDDEKETEEVCTDHLCKLPRGKGCCSQVFWAAKYPIRVLFLTIPDCRMPKLTKLYPLTFCMCVVWMATLTYFVSWMITAIGDTFKIPDSVMGISFLAVGTSIPEAITSVIVARRGYGSMAICNSIGSNTFDILVCLGVPWFIKTVFFPTWPGKHYLHINSSGLVYSTTTLLTSMFLLYTTFACLKFTLGRNTGFACLLLYIGFQILTMMVEMNFFFVVNLPMCDR